MQKNLLGLVAVGFVFYSLGAQAQTVYQVDRVVGSGTVSGFIETDGTIGSLSTGNIVSWSLETDDGSGAHPPIIISSESGGGMTGAGWDYFSATESELLFDFDGAFAFSSASGLFADVQFFGDGGAIDESINYGFAASPEGDYGKKENLVHFFPDGVHYVESPRDGVTVIGTTDEITSYDYQLLDYPGTARTQVFGVNERGDVVGIGLPGSGGPYPFVYSSNHDRFTSVAPAAGYASTSVLGISASGVIVGSVTSLDQSTISGFTRDKKGVFTFFSHPDAVSYTRPRAVNNDGLVSGYRNSPDGTVGFIYDPETETFTDIVPSLFTIAHGINARGDVVGSALFFDSDAPCDLPDPTSGLERYGWLRAADGTVTYFQVNGQRTQARDIADSGFVVGDFLDPDSGKRKGFITKVAGISSCESVTVDDNEILEFPGFDLTLPEGIRNSGDIVGIAIDGTGAHGFIATPQ